jgi:hypothetical protein
MSVICHMKVEFLAGTHIEACALKAQSLADVLDVAINFAFNGVNCTAYPQGVAGVLADNALAALDSSAKYKFAHSR